MLGAATGVDDPWADVHPTGRVDREVRTGQADADGLSRVVSDGHHEREQDVLADSLGVGAGSAKRRLEVHERHGQLTGVGPVDTVMNTMPGCNLSGSPAAYGV